MTTCRCLGVSASASMESEMKYSFGGPLIIDVQYYWAASIARIWKGSVILILLAYWSYGFSSYLLIECSLMVMNRIAVFVGIKSRRWSSVEEPASHRFTILMDLKALSAIRRPWWWVELSFSRMLLLADPYADATYSITEKINSGWTLRSASCSAPQRSPERHSSSSKIIPRS
jgi:hypothetical protein